MQQSYWPEGLAPEVFYQPGENGFEKQITEYAKWLKEKTKANPNLIDSFNIIELSEMYLFVVTVALQRNVLCAPLGDL